MVCQGFTFFVSGRGLREREIWPYSGSSCRLFYSQVTGFASCGVASWGSWELVGLLPPMPLQSLLFCGCLIVGIILCSMSWYPFLLPVHVSPYPHRLFGPHVCGTSIVWCRRPRVCPTHLPHTCSTNLVSGGMSSLPVASIGHVVLHPHPNKLGKQWRQMGTLVSNPGTVVSKNTCSTHLAYHGGMF